MRLLGWIWTDGPKCKKYHLYIKTSRSIIETHCFGRTPLEAEEDARLRSSGYQYHTDQDTGFTFKVNSLGYKIGEEIT